MHRCCCAKGCTAWLNRKTIRTVCFGSGNADLCRRSFEYHLFHAQVPSLAGWPTPLERAEQSEEGLAFVIDMIGAIEAGVYI